MNFEQFLNKVKNCEDPELLDAALGTLPLDKLYGEAAVPDGALSEDDRLVKATVKWFKNWFNWVNKPECIHCGYENTVGPYQGIPVSQELRHGASIVEVWHCPECQGVTRFPRYNDPLKLLETREGRCGEWCNTMTLILRALGRDVRYVWNSEDHVWNEVWSSHQKRWIHIDSCEGAFDTPLMYSDGWGKKMAYVIGFSLGGVQDITKRYVRRSDAALPRALVSENDLQMLLARLTTSQRSDMTSEELAEWDQRDQSEIRELASLSNTTSTTYTARQSGSKEWTQARGEGGGSCE